MRGCIGESLALLHCLPYIQRDFQAKCSRVKVNPLENIEHFAEKQELQIELFSKLLHVIDRRVSVMSKEDATQKHWSRGVSYYRLSPVIPHFVYLPSATNEYMHA